MSGTGGEDWLPPVQKRDGRSRRKADWRSLLIRGRQTKEGPGEPRALLANAVTALREAPEWRGVLAFDEFSLSTVLRQPPPWGHTPIAAEWTDHEDRLAADWLQHQKIAVSVEVAGQAVQVAARDHVLHPVRDYLNGLRWDGTRRCSSWLNVYLGVEAGDYTAAVGERWLRSAVARVMKPGCQADCCLILEGSQGIKKSTALRTMAEPWFSDEIAELGSKDSTLQTRGVWVIEIAELDAMIRTEVTRIKAFMSRPVDRFRPPYARHLIKSPRQCVFAGSVNQSVYLRDETGARRFWPVRCGNILVDELMRDRDQLWAEALVSYRAGEPWWLDTPALNSQAEQEQGLRYEESAWDSLILVWASDRVAMGESSVSVAEALELCIKKKASDWTKADEMRVGRCLRQAKWIHFRDSRKGRPWRYAPPSNLDGLDGG